MGRGRRWRAAVARSMPVPLRARVSWYCDGKATGLWYNRRSVTVRQSMALASIFFRKTFTLCNKFRWLGDA